MTLTDKQRKLIAIIPILIIVYLAVTLLLYDIILKPQINRLTGNVLTTVNVSKAAGSNCSFNLYSGQNLISFHCTQGMSGVNYILENITGDYDSIFSYDMTDSNDPWKSSNPTLPATVVRDLNYLYDYNGYWLIMNKNTTYQLEGFLNTNSQTQLYTGWNLIGYPRENSSTPAVAFASLDGNYDMVLQYKLQNNMWYYYAPGDPNSTLTQIEIDYGYWIRLTVDDIWVYP